MIGHVYVVRTVLSRPPKDKITICVCAGQNLYLWINTLARPHGIGQLPLDADELGALTHDSFLDCSRLTQFSDAELATAVHRGPISAGLAAKIVQYLTDDPPRTLARQQLDLMIANLSTLK